MNNSNYPLLIILTAIWAIFPLISVFLFFLIIGTKKFKYSELKYIILLISLSFGVLSFTQDGTAGKLYDSDVTRYYDYYNILATLSWNDFIEQRLLITPNIFFDLTSLAI